MLRNTGQCRRKYELGSIQVRLLYWTRSNVSAQVHAFLILELSSVPSMIRERERGGRNPLKFKCWTNVSYESFSIKGQDGVLKIHGKSTSSLSGFVKNIAVMKFKITINEYTKNQQLYQESTKILSKIISMLRINELMKHHL